MKKYNLTYFQIWLDKYMNFERAPDAKLFRLETTDRLAALFDHPERSYQTYHVTGSKGKGSVARMLACVLAEAEQSQPVGVYASPHVYDFRERIGTADGFLPDEVYNSTVQEFTTKVDMLHNSATCGSWFELNAAFAMLAYRNAGCRHAVFEVGMGGRLDATNIIQPRLCCITEIELEHTEFLGDTLEKIATEKAGIIKEDTPVVIAAQKTDSVRAVFRRVAQQKHAPLYFADELAQVESIAYRNQRLCVTISGQLFARPIQAELQLLNEVQATNAMQVAVAAKILYPDLSEDVIERGLAKASLPGRFELRGNLVMDGAHTPESIRQTMATFDQLFPDHPRYLLFGLAAGKDAAAIVAQFKDRFDQIFVTKPGDFKKSDTAAICQAFQSAGIEITFDADHPALIRQAIATAGPHPLLVTGSFYLLDEVHKVQSAVSSESVTRSKIATI